MRAILSADIGSVPPGPGSSRFARRATPLVVGLDQAFHHQQELLALERRQRCEDALLGLEHRWHDGLDQRRAFRREPKQAHAAIVGRGVATHQAARFESVDDATDGRGVEADRLGQRALVDVGLPTHRLEGRELHRRDAEVGRFVEEDGHGDLLQAPDVVAGQHVEIDGRGGGAHRVQDAGSGAAN